MKTTLFALVSTSFAVAAFGLACDRTPGAAAATNVPAPGSSSVDVADKYTLELKPVGKYAKGQPATYEIVLKTKGEFHVNEDYPVKYKFTKTDGVKYEGESLHKMKQPDAFKMEKCATGNDNCTLKITVKFTPETAGALKVGGELQVGVCNKETCLVEKKQLDLSINAT